MNATYGISLHTASKIMYTMERKEIIRANENERYILSEEFGQENEMELIGILDRAGNNNAGEIEPKLSEKEKELWKRINAE